MHLILVLIKNRHYLVIGGYMYYKIYDKILLPCWGVEVHVGIN